MRAKNIAERTNLKAKNSVKPVPVKSSNSSLPSSATVSEPLWKPVLRQWRGVKKFGTVRQVSPFKAGLSIFLIALSFWPARSFAADDVSKLLEQMRMNISAHDDDAELEMVIVEANGEKKTRKLKISTLQDSKFHAMAEVLTPVDVKGTTVLSEIDKEHESQWLYTPSSRQVRRLMNVKSGGGVLGSEITMDDLNSTAIKSLRSKLLHRDEKKTVVQLHPKSGTSVYDRVDLTIATHLAIPLKTEYFKQGKLIKTVEFLDYKKFGSVFRAQHVNVKNNVNHRGTELNLVSYHANRGLKVADFSPSRMKDN